MPGAADRSDPCRRRAAAEEQGSPERRARIPLLGEHLFPRHGDAPALIVCRVKKFDLKAIVGREQVHFQIRRANRIRKRFDVNGLQVLARGKLEGIGIKLQQRGVADQGRQVDKVISTNDTVLRGLRVYFDLNRIRLLVRQIQLYDGILRHRHFPVLHLDEIFRQVLFPIRLLGLRGNGQSEEQNKNQRIQILR